MPFAATIMSPLPLPADEPARLATLDALGVLDTPPEPAFDALVLLAARATGAPIALVSFLDGHRQWFKARVGIEGTEIAREHAFCAHTVHAGVPLAVDDATMDPRFAGNPLVVAAPWVRCYAGVPLRVDGHAVGTLCVMGLRVERQGGAGAAAMLTHLPGLAAVAEALLQGRHQTRALEVARRRLADFGQAFGGWLWQTDASCRYTWLSEGFEDLTGLAVHKLIGQPVGDSPLLDPCGDPLPGDATLASLLARPEPFTDALTYKRSPRGPMFVSRSGVPVHDMHGRFAGWRGTARNLSEQVRGAAGARSQREMTLNLSAQVPGILYQFRLDTAQRFSFPFISEGVREFLGLEPEAVRADPQLMMNAVHEDDKPAMEASVRQSAATLESWQMEYRMLHPQRGERWFESRSKPQREADGSTLWHGCTLDITKRKRADIALRQGEERWAQAARAAGIGVIRVSSADETLQLDALACRIHGLPAPQDRLELRHWLACIATQDREAATTALRRAMRERLAFEGRFRFTMPDGSLRWLEIVAHGQCDSAGKPVSLVGTCRDVTAQREAERLKRDKQAAERASLAKSEFLSRVSHELRTPLNGILGFAELMALDAQEPLGPEQRRRLAGVQAAGRRLLGLVSDVLDLTRIERDDFVLPLTAVDLGRVSESALRLVMPLAVASHVQLPSALATGVRVRADSRSLEQVLLNLLSNAIKFNRPGGGVQLELRTQDGQASLTVVDGGHGLTAAQQRQLFQPFGPVGSERKAGDGNGLGLLIARQLVRAMKGRLTVHSEPGVGSRFGVELPLADPGEDSGSGALFTMPMPLTPGDAAAGQGGAGARRPWCVLYIEDEPVNVLLMEEVFRSRPGWRLHVARDGKEGLEKARTVAPDVLLIDMNLPDMSGLDIVARLRRDPATAGLLCIALSADGMSEQIDAARAGGFDDYWTKPIDVAGLLKNLADVLEARRAAGIR
jgi:PAS domain S-box-containing protein